MGSSFEPSWQPVYSLYIYDFRLRKKQFLPGRKFHNLECKYLIFNKLIALNFAGKLLKPTPGSYLVSP